jgi:serine/threonine protein kinase
VATQEPLDDSGPTVARDPLIGAQLGEYKVLSRLGEGAMGIVYRGEQPVIGKPVAIKVLQSWFSADPVYVKKLLEEARAISAARHPNIIDIFSFGVASTGQQYFVMECLDGEPLDIHLRQQGGRLEVNEVVELLKQVMAGLSAAHAAGVVHRDLKPSNIFLAKLGDGTRFVKLLDFGLAKRTAPNAGVRPTANVIVGTALYMAPEQIQSEEVGPWTDLYAVGCIAHELLSGKTAFTGASIVEALDAHMKKAPTPLRQLIPSLPEAIEKLVLELLEKAPSRRPKSAAAVRKTLERIERKLAPPPTRTSGLQTLSAPLDEAVAPTRISGRNTERDAPAIEPTAISLPKIGPIPEAERSTQISKQQLARGGQKSRLWMVVVLAPLLGIGSYLLARKLDTPVVAPIPAVPVPEGVTASPVIEAPAPALEAPVVVAPPPVDPPVDPVAPRPKPTAGKRASKHTMAQVRTRAQELQARAAKAYAADRTKAIHAARELTSIYDDAENDPKATADDLWRELDREEAKLPRK